MSSPPPTAPGATRGATTAGATTDAAGCSKAPPHRSSRPASRGDQAGPTSTAPSSSRAARSGRTSPTTSPLWADPFTAQAAVDEFADLADRCNAWDGDNWTGVHGDINVTQQPARCRRRYDTTALRVHATADAGLTVAQLTSDVIAVRRGAAVAIVTYTRFDARRDELRLGPPRRHPLAARLAAVA